MDKKQVQSKQTLVLTTAIFLSFICGILWQRYYGVHHFLIDLGVRTVEYSDNSDRIGYDITNLKKPLVILIYGQSNVANTVSQKSQTSLPIFNFYKGKLYQAKDPLLGATGKLGSLWIDTAKKILKKSDYKEVILVNDARNNSSIKDWSPKGKFHKTLNDTYHQLTQLHLAPHLIVFGQGERDSIDNMSSLNYALHLKNLYENVQSTHGDKPFLISLSSRCYAYLPNNNIRQAQLKLINDYPSVFQGPDTDSFNESYRYDGCHFNKLGKQVISNVWATKIRTALTHQTEIFDNGIM